MTDIDLKECWKVNGIDSFIQKFDFHKMLWFLCFNITSHRSKQPVIGNVQDDGS